MSEHVEAIYEKKS